LHHCSSCYVAMLDCLIIGMLFECYVYLNVACDDTLNVVIYVPRNLFFKFTGLFSVSDMWE
jgi:hypothetical protein